MKEKVIIWDQVFSNEWAVMKNGGEAFKNTSPTTEKVGDRSLEIKPNKIPKKTEKIGGSFSMLNSGQSKGQQLRKVQQQQHKVQENTFLDSKFDKI